ncbi:aromatic acid exporter family protein [Alkalihalobacillus oceani]|uniref:Aromatic acid exporter family protein n=1 Tax=Halalkalibacter oceani TaxID=1653776 RepID=A0A9X2DPH9_9BACI|nr:aromatic acid exporter family protein [Halalkalibacter oceani]MCM3713715.1 aromatic acid exporter family protein [Halalkalibacter oceani]
MKQLRRFKFIGGRLIKTGIAVFAAASLCQLFGLSAVFAVIIAIVTIEPTVSASIKKGIVRLPAALIGASLAMTFVYFFGYSPVTYTLATVSTIFVCHKLRLQAGTLIATVTAIAMIPITQDHYLLAFFERAGTTTIGLTVSTLVNFLILPANYITEIKVRNDKLFDETAKLFELRCKEVIDKQRSSSKDSQKMHRQLTSQLGKSFQLCQYQREEWKFHRYKTGELRIFFHEYRKLEHLQQIQFHLANVLSLPLGNLAFSPEKKQLLLQTIDSTAAILRTKNHYIPAEHYELIEQLDQHFWYSKHEAAVPLAKAFHHHFSAETILLYVILSIHDVLEELERMARKAEKRNREELQAFSAEDS